MSSGTNKAFAAFLKRNVTRADLNKLAPAARMKALLQEFNASVAPTPRGVGVPTAAPKAAGRPRKAKTESPNANPTTKKNAAQAPIHYTQAAKPTGLTALPQAAPSAHIGPTTEGETVSTAATTAMSSGPVRDRVKRPPTPEMKKKPKTSRPKHNANARAKTKEHAAPPVTDARVEEAVALVAALPIARGAQFRKAIRSHVLSTVNDRDDIRIDAAVDPVGKATAVAAEFLIAALPQLREIAAAASSVSTTATPETESSAPIQGSVEKLTMDFASNESVVAGQSTAAETHTAQVAASEDEEIDEETLALLAQLE